MASSSRCWWAKWWAKPAQHAKTPPFGRVLPGSPNGIRTRRASYRPVRLVVRSMVARGKRSVLYRSVTSCVKALVGQSVGQKSRAGAHCGVIT
jgi:hypothetical protein